MRHVFITLSLFSLLESGLLAELMEFPAASTTTLEIPLGTSIQINYVSSKGDAADYIKAKLIIGSSFYDTGIQYLNGLYINGPASFIINQLTVTPVNGIPYKQGKYGNIWKDATGTGQFSVLLYAPGRTDSTNSEYQTYLEWIAAGNTPLSSDVYTGSNISGSGVLMNYTRYSNQPYKTIIIPSNTTQTVTVPAGKKVIFTGPLGGNMGFGSIYAYPSGGSAGFSYNQEVSFTIRGGYSILPGYEIEGPEIITISYTQSTTTLGGGGSAVSTSETISYGLPFQICTYYFTDESHEPISEYAVNAITTKITSTSGNYGLVTKSDLTAALTQSRTDGINSVISNPNLWTLYTASQIQNTAMGDLVLNKNVNGTFTLNYDIEQSTDLQNWTPYQALSVPLNGLPTDKAFVRVKLKK